MKLALPSREYYLQSNNNAELTAYRRYMGKIVEILGGDRESVNVDLQEIIDLESSLANVIY